MRRISIFFLLCMSVTAVLASAVGVATSSASTTAESGGDPVLFGDQTVESSQDSNPAGVAQAWPFSTSTDGTAASISVYVDSASTATQMMVGLYADNDGSPGSLLASGSLSDPTTGAWNTINIASTAVSSENKYWLALLGAGGTPHFRDRSDASCNSQGSSQRSLTSLPSQWSTGPVWGSCPVSAYVNGYLATTNTTAAPSNTALPTISGTATQGQTLSTNNGTWSGSPTGYSYQWRQCDSSGNNCTNVSGATSSSYSPTGGDVGHTMRAVITATNTVGSTSATSAASSAVAAPTSGSVPCALTAAAESCWATHTGVEGSTGCSESEITSGAPGCDSRVFTHVVGNVTVNAAGTTIDHEWISGCIAVNASNVTIKNTLIASSNQCHGGNQGTLPGQINTGNGTTPTGLLIEDSTVDAMNPSYDNAGVGSNNFTCLRCNVSGTTHNFVVGGNGTIQDSYAHTLATAPVGSHEEDVYSNAVDGETIQHSYLRADGGNGYVAGAVFLGNAAPGRNITIDNSYLNGGQGAPIAIGCTNTNMTITHNAIDPASGQGAYAAGPGTWPVFGLNGNTWSGNFNSATLATITGPGNTCQG